MSERLDLKDSLTNYLRSSNATTVQEVVAELYCEWRRAQASEDALKERVRVMEKMIDDLKLMEKLAEIEHERWSGQAKTALNEMTVERRKRWSRLANMSYCDLSEHYKELDRIQVREYLTVIKNALAGGKVDG